jgi:hypothetical protein
MPFVNQLDRRLGEVCEEDARENKLWVREGFRILSAYTLKTGLKIWIITEADRSAMTFLLPSDYRITGFGTQAGC